MFWVVNVRKVFLLPISASLSAVSFPLFELHEISSNNEKGFLFSSCLTLTKVSACFTMKSFVSR